MHDREIAETPINQFICWCLNDTSVHCFIFTIENSDGARPKHHTGRRISEDNSQCLMLSGMRSSMMGTSIVCWLTVGEKVILPLVVV